MSEKKSRAAALSDIVEKSIAHDRALLAELKNQRDVLQSALADFVVTFSPQTAAEKLCHASAKSVLEECGIAIGQQHNHSMPEASRPDAEPVDLYNVTLPWNPNDRSEGEYATTVHAENADCALRAAAEEMADSGEKAFDLDGEREEYIDALVKFGKHSGYVCKTSDELKYHLAELFGEQLFPDGGRDIDVKALAEVLVESRDRFVIEPRRNSRRP